MVQQSRQLSASKTGLGQISATVTVCSNYLYVKRKKGNVSVESPLSKYANFSLTANFYLLNISHNLDELCAKPIIHQLVALNTTMVTYGTRVMATCAIGYHFKNGSRSMITECTADLTWSVNLTECVRK